MSVAARIMSEDVQDIPWPMTMRRVCRRRVIKLRLRRTSSMNRWKKVCAVFRKPRDIVRNSNIPNVSYFAFLERPSDLVISGYRANSA